MDRATEAAGWADKRKTRKPYKGIGLACCNHVSGNRPFAREFDGGAGVVRIGRDGRVKVFHGESDMGQGQKTVFALIAAERLGVPLDMVDVADVDTDLSPFGFGSFATRGTLMGGNGVLRAAENAFEQLAQVAADLLEANPMDLVCREGRWFVEGSPDTSLGWLEGDRGDHPPPQGRAGGGDRVLRAAHGPARPPDQEGATSPRPTPSPARWPRWRWTRTRARSR